MSYKVGSRIAYRTFDGSTRIVVVIEKHADIKNGCAGFIGNMLNGASVWGYDSQIVRVR